jgi:uncharacterized protein YaaQ
VKSIFAIIHEKDSEDATEALIKQGFTVTRMASTGGFLRYGNVTLLIGSQPQQVEQVIKIFKKHCSAVSPNQHAATIFVLDMPIYKKL